jgi:acyl carrier protein
VTAVLERAPAVLAPPAEPLYVCTRVDGRAAVFRLSQHVEQLRSTTDHNGLSEAAVGRAVGRALRAGADPGPRGVLLRPAPGGDLHLTASAAAGHLDTPFHPRVLRVGDSAPEPAEPADWDGAAGVSPAGGLLLPAGVHVFFRYADRLVALTDEAHAPTLTSSAVRTLAADLGLRTAHEPMPLDRLLADCGSGAITEAFVSTAPPAMVPVGTVDVGRHRCPVGFGHLGPTLITLWRKLSAVLAGRACDRHRWMYLVPDTKEDDMTVTDEALAGDARLELTNLVRSAIAEYWCELLEVDDVAPGDDFFQLGGHSMLAIKLRARLERRFDITVELADLFENTTLTDVTDLVLTTLGA